MEPNGTKRDLENANPSNRDGAGMIATRRIRFPRPRKVPERAVAVSAEPADIVQRDDGMFALGWHDDADGPFPSRNFAEAVRLRRMRHQNLWLKQSPP
jgi:hypothetical protein